MYIKEIYIDGFKSYASRTVLNGFDKSFNAITGLNGSGKSNILDAICFVLGISNLSQVRVNNLQELIYKQGQAGVTKASVSVVFDNSEPTTSPLGYEDQSTITVQRQIMIGGKNKYMINGRNAQLNRVQNLFHSVQLNVNNPHFLIMQGRITKVLNMKPIEILGMVEEAAGTRMYEVKKTTAHKTMIKKDKKLEEITQLLTEEISPKLEKLKKDRTKYIQYNQNMEQIEAMERFCIAFEYFTAENQLNNFEKDQQNLDKKLEDITIKMKDCQQKEVAVHKKIEKIKKQRQSQMRDELTEIEQKVAQLNKQLTQKKSELEHKTEEYEREKGELQNLEQLIHEEEHNRDEFKRKCETAKTTAEELKKKIEDFNNKIENMKRQKEAVSAGIAVNVSDSNGRTITEQVMECRQRITSLKSGEKQSEMRLAHLRKLLEEKKVQLEKQASEEATLKTQSQNMEAEINSIKKRMEELGFNEVKFSEVERQIETTQSEIDGTTNKIKEMMNSLSGMYLEYDKQRVTGDVKGFIANLFKVNDKRNACALEVTAGSKLFQVVVDNEKTAKELIEKGNLTKRITLVPLNNITYNKRFENKELMQYVKQNNASLALDLINYNENVANAMKYSFGATLVSENIDTAEKVAFDKNIMTKTVTVNGDMFDPSGTLTGGSRQFDPENSVLIKLEKVRSAQEHLDSLNTKLETLKGQLNKNLRDKFLELRSQLRLKQHAFTLTQNRMEQSSYYQTKKQIEDYEKEIAQVIENQKAAKIELKQRESEIIELEKQQELFSKTSDEESVKQQKLEMIEKNMEKAKKELSNSRNELKGLDSDKMSLQLQQQDEEIEDLRKQYEDKKREIEQTIEKSFRKLQTEHNKIKESFEKENSILKESRQQFSKSDDELSALTEEKDEFAKRAADYQLEVKELEHSRSNFSKSKGKLTAFMQALASEHKWIKKEKHQFDKPGTEYDFSNASESPQECKERLATLKAESDNLAKSINKKVMTMYEKAEEEYDDLMKKRTIVDNDKKKIETVIEDLDDKKKKAINQTWQKVNEDFGSIFSMLLPGTMAKLEPPAEAKNGALDGLEVRVAFNGVWKDSLTELSGGQRSLLALSLILAMLRFKPAPVYILDEIDAALDPSHTQNIGRMLKTHFSNSQFIVVSLKEGMFQNANVLFKTKFVNGSSTVARVANHRSVVDEEDEMEENEQVGSSSEHAQLVEKRGKKRKSTE